MFQDWNSNSILLCQPCIRRLNTSYDFKKQCILSAQTWKAYLELLSESQKKNESQTSSKEEEKDADKNKTNPIIRVVPNQKFLKLYVGPQAGQNQTSFQNVFLNIIPANALKPAQQEGSTTTTTTTVSPFVVPNVKDGGRNVFLNLNNAFQRFIPVATTEKDATAKTEKKDDVNVTQILTETKTEELSVEIDPTDFGCMSEDSPVQPSSDSNEKDWEEVISGTKIQALIDTVPSLVPISGSSDKNFNKSPYVPIVPKPNSFESPNDEEKYDFFNGGHFLTPKESIEKMTELNFTCELCDRMFDTMKNLRFHIKQFHLGKFPYKCDFCYSEFANRGAYNIHLEKHKCPTDTFHAKETLTLKDFPISDTPPPLVPTTQTSDVEMQSKSENEELEIHNCDVCGMSFQSANGLVRHKVRKHNQKTKKKYFIKGMKNARCDICNRDFSTQSYLQIHLKLHEKKGPNYRGKVFRNKYIHTPSTENGNAGEIIDITKEDQENGTRDPFDEEIEIEDDIPKALKLKINLRNIQRRDTDMEMEMDENDEDNISKSLFSDVSLECEQYLFEHQNGTNPNTACETCKKTFEKKSDLKRFLNSLHSKSMQYKCHLCDSSFCQVSHLTKHLQIHLSSASCTICQKMFAGETEMQKHNEILHDNKANWQCSVCYIVNNEMESLKTHMGTHGNKIIYKCHFCDGEFSESHELSDHIEKHDGSHSCEECKKSFGYQHEKNIHDYSVHNKERHSCELCEKSYKSAHDLVRHKNLHRFHPHLLHNEGNA